MSMHSVTLDILFAKITFKKSAKCLAVGFDPLASK